MCIRDSFSDPVTLKFVNFVGMGGSAIIKAALHQTVALLNQKLAAKNVFAGSVHIMEVVKGTKFDDGTARLEADTIADSFFDLYSRRPRIEWWVRVPNHNDIIAMVAKMADDAAEGKSSS